MMMISLGLGGSTLEERQTEHFGNSNSDGGSHGYVAENGR